MFQHRIGCGGDDDDEAAAAVFGVAGGVDAGDDGDDTGRYS